MAAGSAVTETHHRLGPGLLDQAPGGLAAGGRIDQQEPVALLQAVAKDADPIDWAVPVVYAREPNRALVEPID